MMKKLREYTTCWIRHKPNLKVGTIQFVPSELTDVSVELAWASKDDSEASPEAAFSLINRFCTAVNKNSDIDDRLLRYISEALLVLVHNNNVNLNGFAQTLGIKHKARRPTKEKRDQEIFFEVREHKRSMSNEEAYSRVAKARFISEDRIEAIYKERRKNHIEFLMEMDEYSWEVTSGDLNEIRKLLEKEQSED